MVKTSPFHGGIPSSILGRVTIYNAGLAQLARASALQAGGREFESLNPHHLLIWGSSEVVKRSGL